MDLEIAVMSLSLERNIRIYSSVNTDSMMNDFNAYSSWAPFTHGLCSLLHVFTFELVFFLIRANCSGQHDGFLFSTVNLQCTGSDTSSWGRFLNILESLNLWICCSWHVWSLHRSWLLFWIWSTAVMRRIRPFLSFLVSCTMCSHTLRTTGNQYGLF